MMTGRDLIVYIMSNGLEDSPVFDGTKFVGFLTETEVAVQMQVGIATVRAWLATGMLDGIKIGDTVYICDNFEAPAEKNVNITINIS